MTGGEKPGAGRWKKPKPGEWTLEDLEREGVFRDYLERRWTDERCEKAAKAALESPTAGISKDRKLELLWQARWRYLEGLEIPPCLKQWTDRHFLEDAGPKYVPEGPPGKTRGDMFVIVSLMEIHGFSREEAVNICAKKSGRTAATISRNFDRIRKRQPDDVEDLRRRLRKFLDLEAD